MSAPTDWAALAAHDLRQSLQAAAVQAHALVLQARQQQQPQLASLGQQMGQSLQHCSQLLAGLMDSLPGAGLASAAGAHPPPQPPPQPASAPVSLGPLLDARLQAWAPLAAQRGLALTLRRPEPATWVRTDAHLLCRVLDNLLGNALAHTLQGGVTLELRAADDPAQAGPTVLVTDTGPGLGGLASPAAPSLPGHGLGLLIVRQLCGLLQIELQLLPAAGGGTVASLRWPASMPAADA